MTADAITPARGIRLKGGAPIPPAPSFGIYEGVTAAGQHLGGTVELKRRHVVPVCTHPSCQSALPACVTRNLAEGALLVHWGAEHAGEAS